MEAALAEFRAEELGQDAEEDVDFVNENGMYHLSLRVKLELNTPR